MATVELSFTPLPAHVRTARLVATAVARRSRVEESLLDEVRLAVGEACSRAVEAHRMHCPAEPVRVELSDRDGRFEVVVSDAVPGRAGDSGPPGRHGHDEAPAASRAGAAAAGALAGAAAPGAPDLAVNGSLPAGIGLAVIQGLADDVQISATGGGVTIRMSWPLRAGD